MGAAVMTDPTNVGNQPGDGPLRAGGVSVDATPQSGENLPSTMSESAKQQQPDLRICRDLEAGQRRVKERSTEYLPHAPGEDGLNYNTRLQRAVFFNVFAHTIEGLVGQVFRKDPALGKDVPKAMVAHLENVDLEGTHFDVFARRRLKDELTAGHCAIFVEFPQTGGAQRHSDERRDSAPIRPYWVPILKDNIISWRTTNIDGRVVLTQVVLRECQQVAKGRFGEQEQERYRVLYRDAAGVIGFVLLEISDDKAVLEVERGTYPTQDEIPIAPIASSGGTDDIFVSRPPLLDLALLNIAHYQAYSDYETSRHKTCVPILTLLGFDIQDAEGNIKVVVGPNTVLASSDPNAKAQYTSHTGQSLGECREALNDLKSDMGTLGLAMLAPQKRTAETAQAKELDKATEDSALAVTARGLQDGLERALYFHARYLKLPSGGSVKVNKEFDAQKMQADMLLAWTAAVKDAGVPSRLMLKEMQLGELIDPDENLVLIDGEMSANAAAAADQARIEAQAKADALAAGGKPPSGSGA